MRNDAFRVTDQGREIHYRILDALETSTSKDPTTNITRKGLIYRDFGYLFFFGERIDFG